MINDVIASKEASFFTHYDVELDPKLPIGQNINKLFFKRRKTERTIELGNQQIDKVAKQIKEIENTINQISDNPEKALEEKDLENLNISASKTSP